MQVSAFFLARFIGLCIALISCDRGAEGFECDADLVRFARMGFDEEKGVMCLEGLQPGATVEKVKENTGFDLMAKDNLYEASPPTEEELRVLHILDPERRYTTARGE